jgi:aerobic C4-dicarboxylate transport protein
LQKLLKFGGGLFGQIVIGLIAGILVGWLWPASAPYLKPLSDIFIRAIQMIIGPLIICTVAVGIARAGGAGELGRLGAKSAAYFLIATVVALGIGHITANVIRPGDGFNADLSNYDTSRVEGYAASAQDVPNVIEYLVGLVPNNVVGAFASGDIIQILVFSVLLGLAMASMGAKADKLVDGLDVLGHAILRIVGFIMRLAPLAAFGSMAFAVGEFGIESLRNFGILILCLYGASAVFIFGFLWPLCRFGAGISLFKLINLIREELVITLGTISSSAMMPRLMEKMERMGCARRVVGLVLPAGYAFNMTGSAIYMPMSVLFIAQALNIDLSFQQQLTMFLLLIITSKSMAGVAGSSLIVVLTAIQATEVLPAAGLALILGIDRIQNEIRSTLNIVSNCVATAVLARSEKALDLDQARAILDSRGELEASLESGDDVPAEGLGAHAKER